MQRLKLEFPATELTLYGYKKLWKIIEWGKVLSSINITKDSYVSIWEIKLIPGKSSNNLINVFGIKKIMQIDKHDNYEHLIVYGELIGITLKIARDFDCFIEFPILLEPDKVVMKIFGREDILKKLILWIDKKRIQYRIRGIGKYIPTTQTVLDLLTERQRLCLRAAYENGFYNIPRKAGIRRLSRELGFKTHSTFIEHLRKAEKIIMDAILP